MRSTNLRGLSDWRLHVDIKLNDSDSECWICLTLYCDPNVSNRVKESREKGSRMTAKRRAVVSNKGRYRMGEDVETSRSASLVT